MRSTTPWATSEVFFEAQSFAVEEAKLGVRPRRGFFLFLGSEKKY
jgi:hypothetical protein